MEIAFSQFFNLPSSFLGHSVIPLKPFSMMVAVSLWFCAQSLPFDKENFSAAYTVLKSIANF